MGAKGHKIHKICTRNQTTKTTNDFMLPLPSTTTTTELNRVYIESI